MKFVLNLPPLQRCDLTLFEMTESATFVWIYWPWHILEILITQRFGLCERFCSMRWGLAYVFVLGDFFFFNIYIQSFMRWIDLWVIPAQWDRVSKCWGRQFEALCWLKGTGMFSVLLVVFPHQANANAFQRSMWLKSDLMTSLKVSDGRTCCRSADWCQRSHPLAVYFCQFDLIN